MQVGIIAGIGEMIAASLRLYSGRLADKTRALVKLAIAVGGQMEGAVHSHTRRAVEAGCSAEEIYHVVLLGTTTLGFPTMMKTFSWVDDVLAQKG